MKIKLLTLIVIGFVFKGISQTDGWHVYSRANEITKIIPDDINANEIHLATDIGYIKYNTNTDAVVDYLNLTSQNPAIGAVKDIALDPTSNDIALTLKDGIAIYDGTAVTVYNYLNSGLTIGESTNQFIYLNVDYAQDGSLYIYKPDAFGYQKFNDGSFEVEKTTTFRPQDIEENGDGTKAYFAGSNDGLWELDKATDTWVNYTSSNSGLFQNFLTSLCFDNADNLYIGNYQGLDKLDTSGTFTACNDASPIPVFEININPVNGELLVRNSIPNSASIFGLSVVDFDTCSWTNYREDNTNCLNENVFNACNYDSDGKIFASPVDFSNPGRLEKFDVMNTCAEVDINYLDAPKIDYFYLTSFGVRTKANGNLEIGVGLGDEAKMFTIDPTDTSVNFMQSPTLNSNGELYYELIGYKDSFIVDNGSGVIFIDENNVATINDYGLPNATVFKTMLAPEIDEATDTFFLIAKVFQDNLYKAFKTSCDLGTKTCEPVEEVLTENRSFEEDFEMAIRDFFPYDHTILSIVKANSEGERSYAIVESNTTQTIYYDDLVNIDTEVENEPTIVGSNNGHIYGIYQNSIFEITLLTLNNLFISEEATNTTLFWDIDNDGDSDVILGARPWETFDSDQNFINVIMLLGSDVLNATVVNPADTLNRNLSENNLQDLTFQNPPSDLEIRDFKLLKNDENSSTMIVLTNYGFIVKTNVDTSNITLSTPENEGPKTHTVLFPNPSNNMVSFSNKGIKSATIYDLNGRLVLNVETSTFSIKNLSKGIYMVKAQLKNGSQIVKKLIKN